MSLVVESGAGLSDAESYVSVADATTYHAKHGDPSDWTDATEADQEEGLRLATEYIDHTYAYAWLGQRTMPEDQALDWPRCGAQDPDGFYIAHNIVPQQLKDAASILALKVIQGDTLIPDVTEGSNVTSQSITLGPMEISKTFSGTKSTGKGYSLVSRILAELIGGSGRVYRA